MNAVQIIDFPRMRGCNYQFTVNGKWMIIATTPTNAIKQFISVSGGQKAETVKQVSRYPFIEPLK
jgi:hypothetical protein